MAVQTAEIAWEALTPEQKREKRFAAWLAAPGVQFALPEAEAAFKKRVKRIIDAIQLKKPDLVPVPPFLGEFPAAYCGYTQKDMLYDVDKAIDAANRCTLEFDFDAKTPAAAPQGRVWEILENRQRRWPGGGLPDNGSSQFIEGEYMKADEYDAFIQDETDYRWRAYLPRIWGAAEPLTKLRLSAANVNQFGLPEVQGALKKLMQAGEEGRKWEGKVSAANKRLTELGYPDFRAVGGPPGGAPFDMIGDNLRGQRGIALDMYKRPEKLLQAIDSITAKRLHQIHSKENARLGGSPVIGFALHKGADGFMSDSQFRTFYWPSLRRMILALIEEGFVPELRTQGSYNSRLKAIQDLPKASVIWHFYLTDIELGVDAVGGKQCIVGSVPQSLLQCGTPKEVEAYARRLIDIAGKDGGFMMTSPGALGKEARAENIRAMIKTARDYGVY
ncbi:MAG TPA: uroporphyrinogen decarboxylase family protein [Dehalococcoidales bacterium]|nr:uroporphyrinogen decarboxylase family protein [Dehalococcoidales bacterium]